MYNGKIIFFKQPKLVIMNSLGPHKSVYYDRDIVITMKTYPINLSFGTKTFGLNSLVIAVISIQQSLTYKI